MKNMTLAELSAEVLRQKESRVDLMADTRLVTIAEEGGHDDEDTEGHLPTVLLFDLPNGVEEYPVRRHAHQQLAETLGVGWKLYERLLDDHPDLLAGLGNGLMTREPSTRRFRLLDGHVRAVLSDRYRPRDNAELLEHLLPVLGSYSGLEFHRCEMTEKRLYVKVILPSVQQPVTPKVGDTVQAGVVISNSEVGSGSLSVYPYTNRLICTNGMVHQSFGDRWVHLGSRAAEQEGAYAIYSDETLALDDAAFFAKAADGVRACLDGAVFDAIVAEMRDLAEIRIAGSPVDAIKVIADKRGLTEGEGKSVLEHLSLGGDLSGWGYVNAITATARDLDDADRRVELETIAGRMVHDRAWAAAAAA